MTRNDLPNKAGRKPCCVIYCRVSSLKQKTEGDGLRGQETACRRYAGYVGYEVVAVFADGITGGTGDRPAFKELLAFLDRWQKLGNGEIPVLLDDIKRFAREVEVHFDLKAEVVKRGGRLESPGFKFEDSATGKYVETVMAATAELERNQNREQVKRRMLARLESGYWTFPAPPGYRFVHHREHKKWLVPDNEKAPLVKEALEGFADGRFGRPMDIERFLSRAGFWGAAPPPRQLSSRLIQIGKMLRNPLYAGYLAYPEWGVSLRKARHEAIVTMDTFQRVRERLDGPRQPLSTGPRLGTDDPAKAFVLGGTVLCAACRQPLRGSLSRGRLGGRYAYYHCGGRGCPMYGCTVRRERLEEEFVALLEAADAEPWVVECMRAEVLATAAGGRERRAAERREAEKRLSELERLIDGLADRLADTGSDVVAKKLEERIEGLAREKAALEERLIDGRSPVLPTDAGTLFSRVEPVLRSPSGTWKSGDTKTRRTVARLVFPERIEYVRGAGYGTPHYALPYRISTALAGSRSHLVDLAIVSPNLVNLPWNGLLETLSAWDGMIGPPT